jgi:glutamate---cysteine ligase / carboxylate-amine ligase
MEHAFGSSRPFTVGIEEELLLVDPKTHRLAPVAADVLARMGVPKEAASHEIFAAAIELRSPASRTAGDAAAAVAALRAAAREAGATLMAVGIHPDAMLGGAELVVTERYRRVADAMRGLIRRTPECALHVHVAMPDPETAIRVFNRIRVHLPLLVALSASSPLWFGADSGLASSRFSLVRSYPGRIVPREFRDFAEWTATIEQMAAAGRLDDYTYVWWDVRLHPRLGTIELREMDTQARVEDAAALAALVQALARFESEEGEDDPPPPEAIAESSFRASRDGIDATILHEGELLPIAEVARRTLERVTPHARELGSEDALEGIERIVREGGGAGRQRATLERGGVEAVLAELVRETTQ